MHIIALHDNWLLQGKYTDIKVIYWYVSIETWAYYCIIIIYGYDLNCFFTNFYWTSKCVLIF